MKGINENADGTYTINGNLYGLLPHSTTANITTPRTKEQAWAEMVVGLERKECRAKYPDSVFWLKEGKLFFEHDAKNGYFWCSWSNVWSIFETEFGMEYNKIQDFATGLVEEHFKCNGITTSATNHLHRSAVEEHFKCKGVTTFTHCAPNNRRWKRISNVTE